MCRLLLHICMRPLKVARSINRAMREPHTVGRVTSTDSHAFLISVYSVWRVAETEISGQ